MSKAKAKAKGLKVAIHDGNVGVIKFPFTHEQVARVEALNPAALILHDDAGNQIFKVNTGDKTSFSNVNVVISDKDDQKVVEIFEKPVKKAKLVKTYEVVNIRVAAINAQITEALKGYDTSEVEITGLEDAE